MILTFELEALLNDPDALADFLREVPDTAIASEWGRRRGAKTLNRSGPTGFWSKHNPNVDNCRCQKCGEKRKRMEAKTLAWKQR